MPAPLPCTRCGEPLSGSLADFARGGRCGSCGSALTVAAFPALLREAALRGPAAPAAGEASNCFFHPSKQVAAACASCGRFLCSLCDVELDAGHFCPACVAAGTDVRAAGRLETSRVLYDDIAVSLAVLPLLFFPLTVLTAPAALYLSVRKWNAPSSIIPRRSHLRLAAAGVLAALQVAGWTALIVSRVA